MAVGPNVEEVQLFVNGQEVDCVDLFNFLGSLITITKEGGCKRRKFVAVFSWLVQPC